MEIIKNNKIIAEFLGRNGKSNKLLYSFKNLDYCGQIWFNSSELRFHKDWNWLILVIDEIYSMNEYIKYKDYRNNIICDGGIDINTKFIQITFNDVVEFIKWYNKQK